MRIITCVHIVVIVTVFVTLLILFGVAVDHARDSVMHDDSTKLQKLSHRVCDDYGCSEAIKELHWQLVRQTFRFGCNGLEKIQELHPPKKENEDERVRNSKDIEEH